MITVGIDYSFHGTGLSAINENFKILDTLVFDKYKYFESSKNIFHNPFDDQSPNEELDFVCQKVLEFIDKWNPDLISLEESLAFAGMYRSWMSGYTILKYEIRKRSIPYIAPFPNKLKYYAFKGNASKEEMGESLKEKYQINFDEYQEIANELVDATWLAILGQRFLKFKENPEITTFESDFSAREIDVLQDLLKEPEKFI